MATWAFELCAKFLSKFFDVEIDAIETAIFKGEVSFKNVNVKKSIVNSLLSRLPLKLRKGSIRNLIVSVKPSLTDGIRILIDGAELFVTW